MVSQGNERLVSSMRLYQLKAKMVGERLDCVDAHKLVENGILPDARDVPFEYMPVSRHTKLQVGEYQAAARLECPIDIAHVHVGLLVA